MATLHRVFVTLDLFALEKAQVAWAEQNLPEGGQAIAVGGKALRGIHGE